MADFKVIWDFQSNTASAWTEQWYVTGVTTPAQATGADGALIAARLALLAPSNTLRRIRASDVLNPRATIIRTIGLRGTSAYTGGPTEPEAAIVIQIAGQNAGSRKLWMRGCSGGAFTRDRLSGADAPKPALLTDIAALMAAYKANSYGIRRLTQLTKFPISQITSGATAGLVLLTLMPAGVVPLPPANTLPRIIVNNVDQKKWPRLNGHWSVVAYDGAKVTLRYQNAQPDTIIGLFGTLRSEVYSAVNIVDDARSQFAYFGSHDTRNPISASRGAKRAARIRTLA